MRVSLSRVVGLSVAVLPSLALANVELYEPFDYSTTSSLIGQTDTYISPSQSWALTGSFETGPGPTIVQGDVTNNINSLSAPGLMSSAGNALTLSPLPADNGNTAAPRIGLVNGDSFTKGSVPDGTTIYYSLLLRVDPSSSDVGNNAANPPGTWFAGFNNNTGTGGSAVTGILAALTMHLDPTDADPDAYSLGITNTISAARNFDDAKPISKGDTVFVVGSYTFSATGSKDIGSLWIDPGIGSFGASEPETLPDSTAVGNSAANPLRISSFFVRENQYDPSDMALDEIRVGTTWADVTPRDPSLITGDANMDGVLDSKDYDALTNGLTNNLTGWANGDFNGDGVINADDVSLFQYNFALYGTNTTSAPEPGTAMLALLALAPLSKRRRPRIDDKKSA